jgi:type I restriction enzyme S subunit
MSKKENQNILFVPLGTLAISAKGKKPPVLKEKSAPGLVPYIDIEAFEQGVMRRYTDPDKTTLCNDGDVLMVWDGSRSGLVGYGRAGALGSTLAKISIPLVEKPYLFYFLESLYPMLNSRAKGVGIPHVNPELLWSSLFPVVSEKQQACVVAKIEELITELESGVKDFKSAQEKLKRYRASVLDAAFSGKLIPTEDVIARSENRGYESGTKLLANIYKDRTEKNCKSNFKEPDFGKFPKAPVGWVWCLSDSIFNFVTSGSRGWAKYYSETGALFLRMGNLDHNSISLDLRKIQRVNITKNAEGIRTKVLPNDILISITADVGMIAVVPEKIEESYINQHVALARPVTAINAKYIAWYLASDKGQGYLKKLQRGATKVGLGLTDIRSVPICLPPRIEQNRIVSEIERLMSLASELEKMLSSNLQRSKHLRQSILKQAFSGTLMSQGLNDEPASVLLARIKAERINAISKKKKPRSKIKTK